MIPLLQGVGISLLLTQAVYGLCNIANVAWLFIYLRDSFITGHDRYRWTQCFPGVNYGSVHSSFNLMILDLYHFPTQLLTRRSCDEQHYHTSSSNAATANESSSSSWFGLQQSIPDYFSGVVLLRHSPDYPKDFSGELRFQVQGTNSLLSSTERQKWSNTFC